MVLGDQPRSPAGGTPSTYSAGANAPTISLPKGGGAIRGIGEKFAANPVTGTGSMSVPIATSPGRSGFGPQLSLSYDSGAGNGPFGFGWSLSLPVDHAQDRQGPAPVPRRRGVGRLHPLRRRGPGAGSRSERTGRVGAERACPSEPWMASTYRVRRYRPRIEGLFARIERWTNTADATDVHWRSISKDNITTWYGKTAESRIADPADPSRIFSWLICETRDDKGNAVVYGYKAEDSARIVELGQAHERQAHERNRDDASPLSQPLPQAHPLRQPRALLAGARRHDAPWPEPPDAAAPDGSNAWMFEVVFDYGEHDADAPTPDDAGAWTCTQRPVLLLPRRLRGPHLPPLPARADVPSLPGRGGRRARLPGALDRLHLLRRSQTPPTSATRSTPSCTPSPRPAIAATTAATTRAACRRSSSSTPSPSCRTRCEEVDPASLENLPIGLDGSAYQWTDLHGEGIPGILTEQAGAWFYKRNLSPIPDKQPDGRELVKAQFAPLETVALKPNVALSGGAEFMDLAGDGQPDVVVLDGPTPGLYEHDEAEGWQPFRPFTSRLNRDMRDPNLKFVDLDGDGHADVLITEDDAFVWHASLAEEGFGPARRVAQALDEEKGPRLVFADGTQSIYLADLSRRRPDRPRPHPQRRGLLLAQPGLRPLRRQGHDGQRALVRPPGPVRPQAHPAGRHRRQRHHRHHLPAPRRRAPVLQPVGQQLERAAVAEGLPARRRPGEHRAHRPARQRHRLPGLVVAAARRCAAADALRRPDGRAASRTCWSRPSTTSAPRPASTTPPRPSSTCRTSATANPGSPGCRSRCTWSSASRPTTTSAATASSPATPTTTATSTARSASSAASAWSSSGTPRSSRRSPAAARCPQATTSTPRRTCRRCTPRPGSTPASTSAATTSPTTSPACSNATTRASTSASRA